MRNVKENVSPTYKTFTRFARLKELGTPSLNSLNKLFSYKEFGNYYITGDPGVGLTAVAYEFVVDLSNIGPVLLFDFKDSIRKDRLTNANLENILVFKVTSVEDVLSYLSEIKDELRLIPSSIILDGSEVFGKIDSDWDVAYFPENLARRVNQLVPNSILVLVEKKSVRPASYFWTDVLEVEKVKTIRIDRQPFGHQAAVKVNNNKEMVYVNYKNGRLSSRFDRANKEIVEGLKKPTSLFEGVQGIWNYVLEEE